MSTFFRTFLPNTYTTTMSTFFRTFLPNTYTASMSTDENNENIDIAFSWLALT
jgi:hypothetical protein